ncbi:Phenylacetic acid catabolic protein [Halalkalibacter krulwichiae]|uniref:Phenylacetic acid catabolic protein n=1 Tax=Halalkalibacter krulwichiae TaxID=199441 RepID=A0A1X9M637_9BACI|nr:Phenylacetic acid catabolic protein [Halalkalibacter krulwichiae]ARK28906.1 Phenylacetic acid catabolic protein [Halalkalibacter krulwichiae]
MSNAKNISLVELAETIADNKYILGDRLVEIGISGPTLEATLSSIAMAQQELGHSRLIYRWAFELKGLNGNKVEIKDQTGKAFSSNVEISNWIELIAGLYTTNIAADLVMRAIIEADHPESNPPFSKMLKEQNEHHLYSKSWCKQLLNDQGSIPSRFKNALENSSKEATAWLEQVQNDNLLISEKMIAPNLDLASKLRSQVEELVNDGAVINVN